MYAQGVTVAVLLASAGLAAIHLKDEEELEKSEKARLPEEAWKQMVSPNAVSSTSTLIKFYSQIDNRPGAGVETKDPYVPPSHHHHAKETHKSS